MSGGISSSFEPNDSMASIDDRTRATSIAYFSMEVGLRTEIPTYSGGLGVLAGDTLRAAADLRLPLRGVTLLHRGGYIRQHLSEDGTQREEAVPWEPASFMEALEPRVMVEIDGRPVRLRAWRLDVHGVTGGVVPVYFLDADLPENAAADRRLTDRLYQGGNEQRVRQEALLGLGGVAMLSALGHDDVDCYHMNEGHNAFLTIALLDRELKRLTGEAGRSEEDALPRAMAQVRRHCVFTTHTPVPAGHDKFPMKLVRAALSARAVELIESTGVPSEDTLNMTELGLSMSRYVNGVAMRHGQISQAMFPEFQVRAITNGAHAVTWTAEPFRALFDRCVPGWREDNLFLHNVIGVPADKIEDAHAAAKRALLDEVTRRTGERLDPAALTLGFARRATAYKRADLLLSDPERLRAIAAAHGPLQILYAGKAHPRDEPGKQLIRNIVRTARQLKGDVRVLYLEDYDMALGHLLTSGVDVWVNTPRKPMEACGTSGMKAALNGVPSLSVLDGWWVEGHIEGVTGWAIGGGYTEASDDEAEAASLYEKLDHAVARRFHQDPQGFSAMRRAAIALNGSFFNAQRMMVQYAENAYVAASPATDTRPLAAADASR